MSVLRHRYADAVNTNVPDVQIWNNAAFDHGESQEPSAVKPHCPAPSWLEQPSTIESDSCKENLKPPTPNNGLSRKRIEAEAEAESPQQQQDPPRNLHRDIDAEIEDIQSQIRRLKSRLEALRLEKPPNTAGAKKPELDQRRGVGRVVPAKFMSQAPPSTQKSKRGVQEEQPPRGRSSRRAMSMGPSEIQARLPRRGLSMGPSEIGGRGGAILARSRCDGELTPLPLASSRRKSGFVRPLQGIDEKAVSGNRLPKQAATTGASKKHSKKDDDSFFFPSIRPKKLFRDDVKSAPAVSKKQGRVVASRYGQVQPASVNLGSKSSSDVRKRSDLASGGRVKKRWEIPNYVVIHKSSECEAPHSPGLPDLLPRIRIGRCDFESPRDSGPAKRVADLIGKRSFFSPENDEGSAAAEAEEMVQGCKALRFEE